MVATERDNLGKDLSRQQRSQGRSKPGITKKQQNLVCSWSELKTGVVGLVKIHLGARLRHLGGRGNGVDVR